MTFPCTNYYCYYYYYYYYDHHHHHHKDDDDGLILASLKFKQNILIGFKINLGCLHCAFETLLWHVNCLALE